jgi:hypothetical protein
VNYRDGSEPVYQFPISLGFADDITPLDVMDRGEALDEALDELETLANIAERAGLYRRAAHLHSVSGVLRSIGLEIERAYGDSC